MPDDPIAELHREMQRSLGTVQRIWMSPQSAIDLLVHVGRTDLADAVRRERIVRLGFLVSISADDGLEFVDVPTE